MKTATKKTLITPVTIGWSHHKFQAEITVGKSIRIFGDRATGDGTRTIKAGLEGLWSAIDAGQHDALIAVCDLLEDRGYESTGFMRNVTRDILSGRETNVPARLDCLRGHCQDYHPNFEPFDRTFYVGSYAEHGSYNLSYYGQITAITGRSICVNCDIGDARVRRMKIDQFVSRNWDWSVEKARKRNSEWMD